jgi:hypothetical protein
MTPKSFRESRPQRIRRAVSGRRGLPKAHGRLIRFKLRGRVNRYKPYDAQCAECSLCLKRAVDMVSPARFTGMLGKAPKSWGVVLCLTVGCSQRA